MAVSHNGLQNLEKAGVAMYTLADFKFLLASRGVEWGKAKKRETLRKKWKANQVMVVIWSGPPFEQLQIELQKIRRALNK